jgi:hypothetical protein
LLSYRRVGLVDKLDVIKNVSSYFITCLEFFSLDAIALQQRQDALLYCIVMALIPSAHAGSGLVVIKELTQRPLGAAVAAA